jgi:hypothetical protein
MMMNALGSRAFATKQGARRGMLQGRVLRTNGNAFDFEHAREEGEVADHVWWPD